mgnify:CR=1 FL=1
MKNKEKMTILKQVSSKFVNLTAQITIRKTYLMSRKKYLPKKDSKLVIDHHQDMDQLHEILP